MPTKEAKREVTASEARGLAEEWDAAYRGHVHSGALEARFRDASPGLLLDMLESGRDDAGLPLTDFTWAALVEALYRTFGEVPEGPLDDLASPVEPHAEPADDTMIDVKEVARMVGLSARHVDRKVDPLNQYHEPSFPRPLRVSDRRIRWRASEVKAFVARLEVTRRASRR